MSNRQDAFGEITRKEAAKYGDGNAAKYVAYLYRHESDIAWGINDFGDLRDMFILIIGCEPKKEPPHG